MFILFIFVPNLTLWRARSPALTAHAPRRQSRASRGSLGPPTGWCPAWTTTRSRSPPWKKTKKESINKIWIYIFFASKFTWHQAPPVARAEWVTYQSQIKKYKKSDNFLFPSNLGKKIILITSCTRTPRGDLRQSVARTPLASAAAGSTSPRRCSPAGDQKDFFSGKRIWRI